MKTTYFSIFLGVVLLAALYCNADAKVEQNFVCPSGQCSAYAVSPEGSHIAALANKGSRYTVVIDGVEGPKFDRLLHLDGQGFYPPSNNSSRPINMSLLNLIVFSTDGAHCAYLAEIGDEYIAVLDGKEFFRGKYSASTPFAVPLTFSAGGKHLFFAEGGRLVMDGKPEGNDKPSKVVTSLDGSQYAYAASQLNAARQTVKVVVLNGSLTYPGDPLQFTDTGHLISVVTTDDTQRPQTLLVDGKPLVQPIGSWWISKSGEQIVAGVSQGAGVPATLTMNGVKIPGTEGLNCVDVFFSPDGKRYAAHCKTANFTELMLIDGKRGQEYASIQDGLVTGGSDFPQFTPDSSKFVYTARGDSKSFVIANDEESDGLESVTNKPVVAPPARFAFGASHPGNDGKSDFFIDGKKLPTSFQGYFQHDEPIVFSADGARYAFTFGIGDGAAATLVVDGQEIPGVAVGCISYNQDPPKHCRFLISPDSKHIAYLVYDTKNNRSGVGIDQKLVFPAATVQQMSFSPDSQHLIWEVAPQGSNGPCTLYIDGQSFVQASSSFLSEPNPQALSSDGVLTVFTLEDGGIKRYRVAPSSDTSVNTLLGGVPVAPPTPAVPVTGVAPLAPATSNPPQAQPTIDASSVTANTNIDVATKAKVAAVELTWNDLVRRPEVLPPQCSLKVPMKFQGGKSVAAGQSVNVRAVRGHQVELQTTDGSLDFACEPSECDVLETANKAWAALTPEQRAIDLPTLLADASLWPARVTCLEGDTFAGGAVPAGKELDLTSITADGVLCPYSIEPPVGMTLSFCQTDVMTRARQLALLDRNKRPSRVLAALRGKLVDADGKTVPDAKYADAQIIVLYYGASWCPYCQKFDPGFVKFINDATPKNPNLSVVLMSEDKTDADMLNFMKVEKMTWPAMSPANWKASGLLATYREGSIPKLVVVDRFGKDLWNNPQVAPAAAIPTLTQILDSGAAGSGQAATNSTNSPVPLTPIAPVGPVATAPPIGQASADIGLNPADADVKGLKVNQPLQEFLDAAKKTFAVVNYDETKPSLITMNNAEKTQDATGFVDQDGKVFALGYRRQLHGDEVGAAFDSLVSKYGQPVSDSGPQPNSKGFLVRSLRWTKPGILKPANAGVSAQLVTNPANKDEGVLFITLIMPGEHSRPKAVVKPGQAATKPADENPKPKLDF